MSKMKPSEFINYGESECDVPSTSSKVVMGLGPINRTEQVLFQ